MGFVGEVMENAKGIHIYYIIGLIIFITLFVIMVVRTVLIPKNELVEYKTAILEGPEDGEFKQ